VQCVCARVDVCVCVGGVRWCVARGCGVSMSVGTGCCGEEQDKPRLQHKDRSSPTSHCIECKWAILGRHCVSFFIRASTLTLPIFWMYGDSLKDRCGIVCGFIKSRRNHLRPSAPVLSSWLWSFRVLMQFTVPTGKRSGHPRGMSLGTRMQELQASRRGIQ
jgi:hypothetical protein